MRPSPSSSTVKPIVHLPPSRAFSDVTAVASDVPPDVASGKGRVTGLVLLAATLLSAVQTLAGSPATSRELFNDHWLFTKGDPPGIETRLDYPTLKPWLLSVGAELSVNSPAPARPSGNPGAD